MKDCKNEAGLPTVGIIGGGGYTAGELIRLLIWHPGVKLSFVQSESQAGKRISEVHSDLLGDTHLCFSASAKKTDVVFICRGHGKSADWLAAHPQPAETLIIDLSSDFRLNEEWVYGLPEINKDRIGRHRKIANPGCFATAIQLAILPMVAAGAELSNDWQVHAITGSTGAGQNPGATTHFSWRNNNVSVYKPFSHQHLAEIEKSMQQVGKEEIPKVNFLPLRGNFSRGIFATAYIDSISTEAALKNIYHDFYDKAPFVQLTDGEPHLKQVVNTNKAILSIRKVDGKLFVVSMIDNLLKGASGQAVQNMNLALGLAENSGLQLKAGLH